MSTFPLAVRFRFLAVLLVSLCAPRLILGGELRTPVIFPDYSGTVIPPNIAPLNFYVEHPPGPVRATLRSEAGQPIVIKGRRQAIQIPESAWKKLLEINRGKKLVIEIQVKNDAGLWEQLIPLTNSIAQDPLDGYLVYRLLKPLYNYYAQLGIYQRNLSDFEEIPVLENSAFGRGCLNCHTFLNNDPSHMALQIRHQPSGNPMLLLRSNEVSRVARTSGYSSWHPSGRLIAYSANRLSLFFHTLGECRDVYDGESNLGLYRVDSNSVVIPHAIAQPERMETWPAWSPDGRFLYFCSGPKLPQERYREIRYDLMRVSYHIETDTWGEPQTLVAASATGLSCAQPRISPDNRFLLFCQSPYGHFPIYQPGSDLYLMNLTNLSFSRLEINSLEADTWHCWSSNSRWVVFSSKRIDGVFARPHFSYVDAQGNFSKPFVLPQRDPRFYDSFIKTYNVPELIRQPIPVKPQVFADAILKPQRILRPVTAPGSEAKEAEATQTDEASPAESSYPPRAK